MKIFSIISLLSLALILGCGNLQSQNTATNLSATDFSEKIKQLPAAAIIDVRTPEEFEGGHLQNASNIDWNNADFDSKISLLDKSKPVLVYCLSGGRSGSAAAKMRKDGFKEVYELNGGMMKWRAANLPEVNLKKSAGMSQAQFEQMLNSDKLVLVDFYADWCLPCKKMKPYLEEITKEKSAVVVVLRINVDENQQLCKALKIDALPVLQIYKNKTLTWNNQGFVEKEAVLKQLQAQK